jgi:O-antigen/teichoic acid export membrane protein
MLKKIFFSGVALIPIGLARLGFNAITMRYFGERTTGELNVALSLGMALALPVSAAFGPSVLRFVSYERGRGRPEIGAALLTRLLIWALVLEAAVAGLAFFFRDSLPNAQVLSDPLFAGSVAVGISYSVYLILRNGLYAVDKVGVYTTLEVGAAVLFFGSLAAFIMLAPPDAALLAFLVGYASFCLGALFVLRKSLGFGSIAEGPKSGAIARFAGLAAVGTSASMGLKEIATVLTPTLAGLEGTAFLALALAALTPMHFVPRTLRSLLFAESATHSGRGSEEALAKQFSEISHQLALFNIPIVATVMMFAEPILSVVGATLNPERIFVFQLLAFAGLVDILAGTAANALAGVGRVGVNATGSVLGLLAAAGIWFGASDLGLTGVAIGYVAASLVRAGVPIVVAHRGLNVRITRDFKRIGQLVVLGAGAIALERMMGPWIAGGLHATLVLPVLYPNIKQVVERLKAKRARS